MTTSEQAQLYIIRGIVAEHSQAEQDGIAAAKAEMEAVIAKHEALIEGTGTMAVVLIGAELAAKAS